MDMHYLSHSRIFIFTTSLLSFIQVIIISGCAIHRTVNIKDCSKETVEYNAQTLLPSNKIYHSRVSTFVIHSLQGSKLKPVVGTLSVPLMQDEKGGKFYLFPGVKEFFDLQFENFFYSLGKVSNKKNNYILIVRNFTVNIDNKEVLYDIQFFPRNNISNVFRHNGKVKINTETLQGKSDYEFIDMDFTNFYNEVKDKIQQDIMFVLNNKVKKFYNL